MRFRKEFSTVPAPENTRIPQRRSSQRDAGLPRFAHAPDSHFARDLYPSAGNFMERRRSFAGGSNQEKRLSTSGHENSARTRASSIYPFAGDAEVARHNRLD
jgi:hypothetical protein